MVFFYRNLLSVNEATQRRVMDLLQDCLADDNVEVRETAMKTLSSVVRVSQRQSIGPLLVRPLSACGDNETIWFPRTASRR